MLHQSEWLGNKVFNGGTQPSFTFNFDQSLPWEIDFEYNLGATRTQDSAGKNVWEFGFQWAFQRDLFDNDFAVFVHGFYNAASLPRIPNINLPYNVYKSPTQNAVGAGFIWTASKRLAVYGQVSGGTTKFTPSIISLLSFAMSFLMCRDMPFLSGLFQNVLDHRRNADIQFFRAVGHGRDSFSPQRVSVWLQRLHIFILTSKLASAGIATKKNALI